MPDSLAAASGFFSAAFDPASSFAAAGFSLVFAAPDFFSAPALAEFDPVACPETSAFVFAVFELDCDASPCVSSTETLPVSAGSESIRAESIKVVAIAIVSFERTDCVPRGFNAALETLLVNRAPASVLPGCKSTETISNRQERKKTMYKNVSKTKSPSGPYK